MYPADTFGMNNLTPRSSRLSSYIQAAFTTVEPFWMKGSTLVGAEFHETAKVRSMWHVVGHINGNAICESTCPNNAALRDVKDNGETGPEE